MLVSQTETLAQDLRRQDLLTRAAQARAACDHQRTSPSRPALLRQMVGATLIQAGRRLTDVPHPEPAVEPLADAPLIS